MKRYIMAGLIFVFPALSAGSDIQVYVNGQEPSEVKCFVSCPSENGFPNVPQEYPCNAMPEIGKGCTVMAMALTQAEKVDLPKIIRDLQVLTGGRE